MESVCKSINGDVPSVSQLTSGSGVRDMNSFRGQWGKFWTPTYTWAKEPGVSVNMETGEVSTTERAAKVWCVKTTP